MNFSFAPLSNTPCFLFARENSAADTTGNKFLRSVVSHAFQAEVARGDFNDDGEISAGADGNDQFGDFDAEIFLKGGRIPDPIVFLALLPIFELNDDLYLFLV